MLKLLYEHRGDALSRDRFLDEIWGYHASPSARTVDNFITELRKKIGPAASLVETVRGVGYRLRGK
jgi:two-component system alkaline phosphatase synthesis response regulator PhoP